MFSSEYTVEVKKFEPTDPRLGRHVRHDSRSLRYLSPTMPRSMMVSMRHLSMIPVLNQGNLGSCTGNAATKNMSYGEFWLVEGESVLSTEDTLKNEIYAVGVYSAATELDPWEGSYPPDDTGSDGLSVAKVLRQRGLINGYTHATSLDAVLTALQTQPVITGTTWTSDMFDPDSEGRLHITGSPEGGHEYVLDEVDMENKRVWMQNSWGLEWGFSGRAWFTFDDYAALLADYGDATIFVPLAAPPPVPTPEVDEAEADKELAAIGHKWLARHPIFSKNMQRALAKWLDKKNL